MRALQDVGLVDQVGVSNYSLDRWVAAEAALGRPVLSNQVQYSLAHRGPEDDLLPYAAERGRLVIAYSPLAQGLLSGRYSAANPPSGRVRRINPLFLPVNLERAERLLATLREVADAHDVSMSQAALAYLVHHPGVVAIPGASSVAQVESNAAAGDIELRDDEVAALAAVARDFEPITGRHAVGPLLRPLASGAEQAATPPLRSAGGFLRRLRARRPATRLRPRPHRACHRGPARARGLVGFELSERPSYLVRRPLIGYLFH